MISPAAARHAFWKLGFMLRTGAPAWSMRAYLRCNGLRRLSGRSSPDGTSTFLSDSLLIIIRLQYGTFIASVGGNRGEGNIKKLIVWKASAPARAEHSQTLGASSTAAAPKMLSAFGRRRSSDKMVA